MLPPLAWLELEESGDFGELGGDACCGCCGLSDCWGLPDTGGLPGCCCGSPGCCCEMPGCCCGLLDDGKLLSVCNGVAEDGESPSCCGLPEAFELSGCGTKTTGAWGPENALCVQLWCKKQKNNNELTFFYIFMYSNCSRTAMNISLIDRPADLVKHLINSL